MSGYTARAWTLALLLAGAALAAAAWRADIESAAALPAPDLSAMIPERFAGWQVLNSTGGPGFEPRVSSRVAAVYSDTLERIYRHREGELIMLSIAYGARQLDDREQAHRPEYCYSAQGFAIGLSSDTAIDTSQGSLPVRRLLAQRGPRVEPITYWLTVGRHAALPGLTRQLRQLRYGLLGEVPDGVLVRVSSLDRDRERAWAVQARFIDELLQTLPAESRERLAGIPAQSN